MIGVSNGRTFFKHREDTPRSRSEFNSHPSVLIPPPAPDFYVYLCQCIKNSMARTKQVKRYVYPVQLDAPELEALDTITDRLHLSKSEAIRDAVRNCAEQLKGLEVVKIREVSRSQARKEILEFLDKKDRAWASEIADALRFDISFVDSILEDLWSEKRVEPTD